MCSAGSNQVNTHWPPPSISGNAADLEIMMMMILTIIHIDGKTCMFTDPTDISVLSFLAVLSLLQLSARKCPCSNVVIIMMMTLVVMLLLLMMMILMTKMLGPPIGWYLHSFCIAMSAPGRH